MRGLRESARPGSRLDCAGEGLRCEGDQCRGVSPRRLPAEVDSELGAAAAEEAGDVADATVVARWVHS